eukprot:m51a1_g9749 hypothetical protein (256) ;mRNA; f:1584283-1585579
MAMAEAMPRPTSQQPPCVIDDGDDGSGDDDDALCPAPPRAHSPLAPERCHVIGAADAVVVVPLPLPRVFASSSPSDDAGARVASSPPPPPQPPSPPPISELLDDRTTATTGCPALLRCKAPGCTEMHAAHYCRVCRNPDSDHRAALCPLRNLRSGGSSSRGHSPESTFAAPVARQQQHQHAPAVAAAAAAAAAMGVPSAEALARGLCPLCGRRARNVAMVPCGHLFCCAECWGAYPVQRCSACGQAVFGFLRIQL